MKPSAGIAAEVAAAIAAPGALAAPALVLVRTETQRVACPYEAHATLAPAVKCVGYCEITAEFHGDKMQIPGFKEPHKCVVCGRWFKLVPVVTVVGDRIPGE